MVNCLYKVYEFFRVKKFNIVQSDKDLKFTSEMLKTIVENDIFSN